MAPPKLYSASLLGEAKPAKLEPTPKADKKPRTEAQIAALQKASETRKRKREEAAAAASELKQQQAAEAEAVRVKQEAAEAKKRDALERRRLQRLEKKHAANGGGSGGAGASAISTPPASMSSGSVDDHDETAEAGAPKTQAKARKRARRGAVDGTHRSDAGDVPVGSDRADAVTAHPQPEWVKDMYEKPPKWLVELNSGFEHERQVANGVKKVGKKQVKAKAEEQAAGQWNDPLTRDRLMETQHRTMNTMYQQVFGTRRAF